ncbi:rab-GTPase-TBC domain-containing protein [Fimicolochytrium jonesii]|uniref:rab-GTPase-TBC domain-containing protein n=1 Tax=Fimicolochytrium jonesii TaxID=1396493 RepID=UPI0022FE29E4|nr:rab-GTPase-TBC domain-containing protein [Fimicolochytrium jonesii]KAI8822969.1 rab-GTPase-TBC domain-containing protein [Fimicolochytrium jonesii]
MSSAELELLFAMPHVSIRTEEANPTIGYLCLISQSDAGNLLAWVPRKTIPRVELDAYAEVVSRTRKARKNWGQPLADIIRDGQKYTLSGLTESISAPLDDIDRLGIGRDLTLNKGEEVCLVRLTVNLTFGGAQLPDLWFENDDFGRPPSLEDVEEDLRGWFEAIGKNLAKAPTDGRPNADASHMFQYRLSDKFELPADATLLGKPQTRKWPEGWPAVPEESAVHRFGSYGFNVVTQIVGQPMANKIEDVGWNMLERFSKVTNIAKNTTVQVLEHPLARPILPYIPQNVRSLFLSSAEAEALLAEYEPAGQYVARFAADLQSRLGSHPTPPPQLKKDKTRDFEVLSVGRRHHRTGEALSAEQWISWYDHTGKLTLSEREIRAIVFSGGVENDVRVDVWKYLLKVYPYDSTDAERTLIMEKRNTEYEDMKAQWQSILLDVAQSEAAALKAGLTLEQRESQAGDEKEDADVVTKIKERKYRVEKDVVRTDRTIPFFANLAGEEEISPVSPSDMQEVISANRNLEMLRNILVTYTMYNFELGYVQGMNDLLAPILVVMQNENEAFWCLVQFMEVVQSNFFRDQSGMRKQLRRLELLIKLMDPYLYAHMEITDSINLFCCFRWLLIYFKREFEFADIMRLWEVMWACPLTKEFHLFVAFAILNQHRQELMAKTAFDETLKYINDLSGHIHLESTLERAEILFKVFGERIGEAAREKLGVDLAVDAGAEDDDALFRVVREGYLSVPPGGRRSPSPARGRTSTASSAAANGTVECSEEELWELIELLQKR